MRCPVAPGRAGCRRDLEVGIQNQDAFPTGPQRVDLQGGEFAPIDDHLRDLEQGHGERIQIDGPARTGAQFGVNPGPGHQFPGQMQVQGRQGVGEVIDGLAFRAAASAMVMIRRAAVTSGVNALGIEDGVSINSA